MIGPRLQPDLINVLLNFRVYKIALTADIQKMYRQILVSDKHQNLQRIVFETSDGVLNHYKLRTVIYGTARASFLSVRCLQQLALECKDSEPNISKIISSNFYVDDLLTGPDSPEEATQLMTDLIRVLKRDVFD